MRVINNAWYEENADQWWQQGSPLALLQSLNPGRMGFLDNILRTQSISAKGCNILDIGCGGGLMTEVLAKKGFTVTGIDPSSGSLEAAKKHALLSGFNIDYQVATGESLPFDEGKFDMVSCCDVLEHVEDLPKVISEITRVLKPGGIFFYDTINQTVLSWLLMIKLAQDIPLVRMAPKDAHVWSMFIKPSRLNAIMHGTGLSLQDECGLGPQKILFALPQFLKLKLSWLTPMDFGQSLAIGPVESKSLLYMGWAIKR